MEAVRGWVSDLKKQDVAHSPTNVKIPAKGQLDVTHFLQTVQSAVTCVSLCFSSDLTPGFLNIPFSFDFVIPKIIHCQELSGNYRLKQRIILTDFPVCFLGELVSLPSSTKNCSSRKFIYLLKFTYYRCRQCTYGYQRALGLSSLLQPLRGVWGLNSSLQACSPVPLLTSFPYTFCIRSLNFKHLVHLYISQRTLKHFVFGS